ncbi:hypothetical protein Nepgr_029002 [Nepenthes gracilis]|uniref:Uncharacterized protein n=1 Tax=Nepenthes gracilis TaxID=150966 RepID=A0AAD3TD88_NEPGR|nr:hypothetical protein Nepgr_029002 [Nepenthes gracilis]
MRLHGNWAFHSGDLGSNPGNGASTARGLTRAGKRIGDGVAGERNEWQYAEKKRKREQGRNYLDCGSEQHERRLI